MSTLCEVADCHSFVHLKMSCKYHYHQAIHLRKRTSTRPFLERRRPSEPLEAERVCIYCNQSKDIRDFTRHSNGGRGSTRKVCSSCASTQLRCRRMGITIELFHEMLAKQDHQCAICKIHIDEEGKSFSIDHDHSCCSGKASCGKCVRGLLCTKCNTGLGMFRDNEAVIIAAAGYIRQGILKR